MEQTKIILDENEMPKRWYNVLPDLPTPLEPPLDPKTREVMSPEGLEPIFPKELIRQEMSNDRYIGSGDQALFTEPIGSKSSSRPLRRSITNMKG
jgi:tryptophan synthase beta chain